MFLLPVRDENPRQLAPIINWAIIILNFMFFGLELLYGNRFVAVWSFIPARLTAFLHGSGDILALVTIFTAMFMHAGWGHILGNMLFLWLFGDNVEDAYGHAGYLVFYVVCGVGASVAQYLTGPGSEVINLGASGAISGVMGAYILMYPRAKVRIFFFPFSIFLGNFGVPAWLMLGVWFLAQLPPALQAMGDITGGGVAYWAHVGGFIIGLLITLVLRPQRRLHPVYHRAGVAASSPRQ